MIPKIIHQIWIGKKSIPNMWLPFIQSWKDKNPEYEYILWNEDKILNDIGDEDGYLQLNVEPAFISDYFRYKILYKYGGFYLDVDFNCLKPIREWKQDFDNIDFFCVSYCGVTQNGLLAAKLNSIISYGMFSTCSTQILRDGAAWGPEVLNNHLKDKLDTNEKILIDEHSFRYFPQWNGVESDGSNPGVYTSNDPEYSTWYSTKLSPHNNILNNLNN